MRERERERRTGRSIDSWMDGWLERQTDCCEVRPFSAASLPKRHELSPNRLVAALSRPILLSASASIDIPNSRKKRFFEGSSTSPWKVRIAACCHHTTERGREGERESIVYTLYLLRSLTVSVKSMDIHLERVPLAAVVVVLWKDVSIPFCSYMVESKHVVWYLP